MHYVTIPCIPEQTGTKPKTQSPESKENKNNAKKIMSQAQTRNKT